MSITQQPQAAVPPPPAHGPDEVRVYSHSNVFYWWPVWAVGFIMGGYTWFIDGSFMVTVPPGTKTFHAKELTIVEKEGAKPLVRHDVDGLYLPEVEGKGKPLNKELARVDKDDDEPMQPRLHMSRSKNLGVLFCTVLLLVITITNVPLRGMWSVVVIISIALLAVIIALIGAWERIVTTLAFLDIRINAGGYFFLSGVLCGIWALAVFVFDRQTYIIFTPGQFKVCQSIGEGEKVYDTVGLSLERQRGDVFRHFILGLGSGDLIVKTTGAQAHHFDLPNVLFISRKVQLIEDMLRERTVKTGK
jgi:hypothetical protein